MIARPMTCDKRCAAGRMPAPESRDTEADEKGRSRLHAIVPRALSYTLYVTATDALGQRSTKKLRLTVRGT